MSAAICIFAGCSDLTMENFRKNKLQPEMFFDFNTTSRVKIDIDYGEYGQEGHHMRILLKYSHKDTKKVAPGWPDATFLFLVRYLTRR